MMNNTLIKGLKLLEVLARQLRPMGVSELASATGMAKSGAHRLLQALLDEHYIVRRGAGTYAVSMKLWTMGSAALPGFDLRRHAHPVMEALMRETGETAHLSVLDGNEVVYVHKVESETAVRAYSHIGGRAPAHCVATGKAMIAYKTPQWLERAARALQPATTRTITDPDAFRLEMRSVRRNGYAINRGEWREAVHGVAAPIFGQAGDVVAAIGISGPRTSLNEARIEELSSAVSDAAQQLSSPAEIGQPHASLLNVTRHWHATA